MIRRLFRALPVPVQVTLELAYDLACEALRPADPPPMPLTHRDSEIQARASREAGRSQWCGTCEALARRYPHVDETKHNCGRELR